MLQGYLQADNSIIFGSESTNIIKHLPLGVYIPKISPEVGIYLSKIGDFEYLNEYYLLDKFETFVLETYKNSKKSIGAIYLGLKGSGKTKRAHKLALDSNMPVICLNDLNVLNHSGWKNIINSPFFNDIVIFVDEYEKKLKDETSVALLEWMDGSSGTKQLFILLGNDSACNKFSNPLNDRLSRILFKKEFGSLTLDNIKELVNKLSIREDKEELVDIISAIPVISLDNCLQIINVCNLFKDENPDELVSNLNIQYTSFELFTACDLQGNKINEEGDDILLSLSKTKLLFKNNEIYFCLDEKFVSTLEIENLNESFSVFVSGDLKNGEVTYKYINRNTVQITAPYAYFEKGSDKQIKSERKITFNLIKSSFYYISKNNNLLNYLAF